MGNKTYLLKAIKNLLDNASIIHSCGDLLSIKDNQLIIENDAEHVLDGTANPANISAILSSDIAVTDGGTGLTLYRATDFGNHHFVLISCC